MQLVARPMRVVAAISLVATIMILSGCNRNYEIRGPYSLGNDGRHLLIGFCEALFVDHIFISASVPDGGAEPRVWDASGSLSVGVGDKLTVSPANDELTTATFSRILPRPGVRYFLLVNDASQPSLSAAFAIPEGGLPAGKWLTPLGELRNSPCT